MEDDGAWGVYREACAVCGVRMWIVAPVALAEAGEVEAYADGPPVCRVCREAAGRRVSPN